MDKNIVDTLIKFGLITNIGISAENYKDVDDLINKGVVTIPGAKDKINELLKNINVKTVEAEPTVEVKDVETEPTVEVKDVEPAIETPVKRTKKQNKN